jgi:hypothetical protein
MRADTEWEWCGDFARVYLKKERDDWGRGRRGHRKNAIRDAAARRVFRGRACIARAFQLSTGANPYRAGSSRCRSWVRAPEGAPLFRRVTF